MAYVRKSTTASEILEGHLKLQMANQTRWNSQLKMLRSIIRIPEDILQKLDCTSKLSSYEMKLIGKLCEILQPFEEVTDRVQGQAIVTSSLVIACVRGLRHTLTELRKTYNNKLVMTLQASLEKCLLKYEEMPYLKLAAVLDPRFKMDWCTEDEVAVVHALLRSTVTPAPPHTTTRSDEPPTKCSKLFTFMSDRSVQMPPVTISPTNDELNMYLNQPCESEDSDPLMFWQNCAMQFPCLSRFACKYLAMPASSAPVERLFSVAGKVFRPERCCLSDYRFEQLMMIRCNNAQ